MHVDSIDLFHVAIPLRTPQATPAGPADRLQTVLLRMQSGEASGWGEASPGNGPWMASEWTAGVFHCLRDWLAPAILGKDLESGAAIQEQLACFRGNVHAKAALDTAWWDLESRLRGEPLHRLLGGKRDAIEVGVGFDRMETIDELLAAMGKALEAGHSRIELKFRPGWDLSMLNHVRHEFPTQTVHIDCEAGLRLEHMEILLRLDDFSLAMVEQPLPADDLVGHAMVQESIRTPICLDESIATLDQVSMALELHSGRFVNVKYGRVGGLTPAIAIHDACHEGCIPCWVAAVPQSAIGARFGYALAAKENFTYPADYLDSSGLFAEDLAEPAVAVRDTSDGKLRIPLWSQPGIGVEPDLDRLERFCLARAKL